MTGRDTNGWISVLIQCGVAAEDAGSWAPYMAQILGDETFDGGDEELAQFLGQCLHESTLLTEISENLNYTVEALNSVFGPRRISAEDAAKFGRSKDHEADQVSIANTVYGGSWGLANLGNKNPGDGWSYRGSGLIQVTGFSNFLAAERATDIPFSSQPDLMRQIGSPPIEASVAWWHAHVTTSMLTDSLALRKCVNGPAALGLQDCITMTQKARAALASVPAVSQP